MRKSKFILAVLALAALPVIAAVPSPAGADHANEFANGNPAGHWGNRYAPPVGYCYINQDATGNVQDAAYYWQDTFLPQGYNPPLPRATYTTDEIVGWINSCTVEPWHWRLEGHEGNTWVAIQCDNACNHINRATIFVSSDLNANPYRRQQVWRHEFGHAVGLGHTNVANAQAQCVMFHSGVAALGSRCQHDIDAMHTMYDHPSG